ncbi:MAG: hypothetical protein ABI361_10865 [Nitrososphaera sp.]
MPSKTSKDRLAKKTTPADSDKQLDEFAGQVPKEIDSHLHLYGKHAWEVQYGERCPICDKRIDEFGFCACGSTQ